MRRALVITSLALTVLGCERAPAPVPTQVVNRAGDEAAEARKAMDRRDWSTAAPLFRSAIVADPENVSLHYGVAICASQLDLRDEAIKEFQWVLAHAATASEEARVARAWLVQAGLLPSVAQGPSPDVDRSPSRDVAHGPSPDAKPDSLPRPATRPVHELLTALRLLPLDGQTPGLFTVETLHGAKLALADLHGRPVLLYFWASW